MVKIESIVCTPGRGGFFFDDQRAIKANARQDGFIYRGRPLTPGFDAIRQAGESISVMLLLSNGQIALGDCAAIQYSGAGGRDPLFLAQNFIRTIKRRVTPLLAGAPIAGFRESAAALEALDDGGRRLHAAIRYGVSQALLDATAKATGRLMCEVIADEYGLKLSPKPVKIFAQSGDDRFLNADKMILKRADVIPHGLINNVPDKLGRNGEKLLTYIRWLKKRTAALAVDPAYRPTLHIDVYGTIGIAFGNDLEKIARYFQRIARAAEPFEIRIEGPVDLGARDAQCAWLKKLRTELKRRRCPVGIVADEWCNSMDDIRHFADAGAVDVIQIKTPVLGGLDNSIAAVAHCKRRGIGAYLGGTCNETDVSARACVHVALATRPCQMLAKPGMGVDEGFMVVYNEMHRAIGLLRAARGAQKRGRRPHNA